MSFIFPRFSVKKTFKIGFQHISLCIHLPLHIESEASDRDVHQVRRGIGTDSLSATTYSVNFSDFNNKLFEFYLGFI